MDWHTLKLLGVLIGLLAFAAAPLVLLPWYLARLRRARTGRFSVFLLLYVGYFFLPSIPNFLLTLSEIGNVLIASDKDQTFGEFLFTYVIVYGGIWFFWVLAALATVMVGYRAAQPSGPVEP